MEYRLVTPLLAVYLLVACHLAGAVNNTYSHYRLPTSLQPEQYQLRILTHLENPENLTSEGQVSIRFQALEDTNNITLHAGTLTIDDKRIQLKSYEDDEFRLCLDGVETVPEHDYYIIRLCQPLLKGQKYKVLLEFAGILNDTASGYYRSSYVDKVTNETRWLSVTHFEPAYARQAFPCFDEPNYKATFVIWLGHHKSLKALSNMPLEKEVPIDNLPEYVWSIFEESVPMSTYLVAYSVSDFVFKESRIEGNDVIFRTWCRPDYIEFCSYAAEVAPKVLQYYEDLFAIPFPLKKLDQIAVPDFKESAMENWGLIVYDEKCLVNKPNVSSNADRKQIARVIAHELAHQWFGNLVTMKWWTDLWLNEGFATYVASLGIQHLMPEFEMYYSDALSNAIYILEQDVKLSSHAVSQPISVTKDIMERFDDISYGKGSDVLRMMHSFLGQNEFFDGVRDYLTKHKYQNAEQDDLWAAFNEIAQQNNRTQPQHDIKTIMDSWTLQTGFPVVNVRRNYENGTIEISQQRFLENATLSSEEAHKCWWVPLSYTTASELDFNTLTAKAWLECDSESEKSILLNLDHVAAANEWVIFNLQFSGIYRVMYDAENWRLLKQTLNSNNFTDIHVMNRAQLLDDVLAFAWRSYSGYDVALDIMEYLGREREYLPWSAAASHFVSIFYVLVHSPEHHAYFKSFVRNLVEPLYFHVGGLNKSRTEHMKSTEISLQATATAWACYVGVEDCIRSSIQYVHQWKLSEQPDEINPIPVDLRDIVYCTAIRYGETEDLTFLWQRYKAANLETEKSNILESLACSHNATDLKDLMALFLNKQESIPKDDVILAFNTIKRSEIGFPLALEYYTENISQLHESDMDVVTMLTLLSHHVASTEDQHTLNQLIETYPEYFSEGSKSVASAREIINLNLQWVERNLDDFVTQIHRNLDRHTLVSNQIEDEWSWV